MATINREHKDRLFRLIFADEKNKANTLALYNALSKSSYTNEDDLEITTIEDAIYLKMKNDLSFVIADTMNLYEQQSTHNPNMPLRGFIYYGSLYAKYMQQHRLTPHVSTLVKIPTPNYIVFYTGISKRPATEKLRLSDAFQIADNRGEFEWTATVINLKHEDNKDLLQSCKPLSDYTTLVSKIQSYQKSIPINEAVNKAVEECIEEGILAEFLKAHRAEVLEVYLAEVDEDILRERLMEEGEQRGVQQGIQQGIQQGQQIEREANLQKFKDKICRKIAKGKTLEQIADELEEEPDNIRPLYEELIKNQ